MNTRHKVYREKYFLRRRKNLTKGIANVVTPAFTCKFLIERLRLRYRKTPRKITKWRNLSTSGRQNKILTNRKTTFPISHETDQNSANISRCFLGKLSWLPKIDEGSSEPYRKDTRLSGSSCVSGIPFLLGCQYGKPSRNLSLFRRFFIFRFLFFLIFFRVGKSLACHSPAKWCLCA